MIIKLTTSGKRDTVFVNFDYVRTMYRDGNFTELIMSDDKYHKLTVSETPEEIYDMLYPPKVLSVGSDNPALEWNEAPSEELISEITAEAASTSTKKFTTKKLSNKSIE